MSMPSDDDVSVASTTDEHTHESESCSVVDMAALEDFSDKFVRKPVTDVIAEIARNTMVRPLRYNDNAELMESVVREMVSRNISTAKEKKRFLLEMQRKHKHVFLNAMLLYTFRQMVERGKLDDDPRYAELLRAREIRSKSGVMVVAVFTSPYPKTGEKIAKFSCPYDCHYCPAEPGQPRSYLLKEPGVLRANRNNFNAISQFWDRCMSYHLTGHPVDKIELLVLGGTWSSYPHDYQEEFVRDLFYAANTFHGVLQEHETPRVPQSLEAEQLINETAQCRVIGVTIETRPDTVWAKEVVRLRRLGVTRVQLGVQHSDDDVLKFINRGCTTADAIKTFKLLKDCCFKIDMHLMPDLPSSDPDKDWAMFQYVLDSPDLQADQWKIYPCETTPWTRILEWYNAGQYKPYGDSMRERTLPDGTVERYNPLFDLILRVKQRVHPWIRLNRVIRDIPGDYIEAGNACTNLRQMLGDELKRRGQACRCIRCRECKGQRPDLDTCQLLVREYEAAGGRELFLSYEDANETTLYGFLRLRLSPTAGAGVFPELADTALIRELHVYGQVVAVGDTAGDNSQHVGFGTGLLRKADALALANGFRRIAVISGVGTREYYRKRGFADDGHFLTKTLDARHTEAASGEVLLRRRKPATVSTATAKPSDAPTKTSAAPARSLRSTLLLAAFVAFLCFMLFVVTLRHHHYGQQ